MSMTILLIENDKTHGFYWEQLLLKEGHIVEWLVNGNCILTKMPMFPSTDLIICDYLLNDGESLGFIRRVRDEYPIFNETPIILMSGYPKEACNTLARDHVFKFLQKPFDGEVLKLAIKEFAAQLPVFPKPLSWPGPAMAV